MQRRIDYAQTRPEIAADKIVLFGYSMGGYLIARAAAFDQRIAALILDDGIYDFHTAFTRPLPPLPSVMDRRSGRDQTGVEARLSLGGVAS
jgi:pimeloyl-ACP methyl ester carboxylesterase